MTELQASDTRVKTTARRNQHVKLAGSVEHWTAMANAALPLRIKESPPALFGSCLSRRELWGRTASGKLSQRVRRKETIVGALELSDPIQFGGCRSDGIFRMLVNGAQSLMLEIFAGFAPIGHEEFLQCGHVFNRGRP